MTAIRKPFFCELQWFSIYILFIENKKYNAAQIIDLQVDHHQVMRNSMDGIVVQGILSWQYQTQWCVLDTKKEEKIHARLDGELCSIRIDKNKELHNFNKFLVICISRLFIWPT